MDAVEIRVRGRVQGVGFRPTVWRLARELELCGDVANDAAGVLIHATGTPAALASFVERLAREAPPLARIEAIETRAYDGALDDGFRIVDSALGPSRTEVAPDAAICADCAREVLDPTARRYRYPFTTCTHCGPRLSLVTGVPYDRARTTMAAFDLCEPCAAEYRDPADRRFHAETTACAACGPRTRLVRLDDGERSLGSDDLEAVIALLEQGEIIAIKGLGGFHLACDATRPDAVARLRRGKQRDLKPFALMARDLAVIRRHALVTPADEAALTSAEAPIVLLRAAGVPLPAEIAPGLGTLGFMLPTTPLHLLLVRDRPLVMTSGNRSDEPQAIGDDDARRRLAGIASHALLHDRDIANRVDDSIVRVLDGSPRVLRRARGYAPSPIALPPGFEHAPSLLAYGADLKSTFCLVRDGAAILSQHQGDLENVATFDDYRKNLQLYTALFDHAPTLLVADRHPAYGASKLARDRAAAEHLPLFEVQHHHAHIAACLVEHGRPLDAAPVLGVVLDGLGFGDDGALWGGEAFVADYRVARRVGTLRPTAMLGGEQASREPWRNLYAQLVGAIGWPAFSTRFAALEVHRRLEGKPRAQLDRMLQTGFASPLASSCGRLFDAFAALLDQSFERQAYEGEAAMRLEALVDESSDGDYPFAVDRRGTMPTLEPMPMWLAALDDLAHGTAAGVMAARFHRGLGRAIATLAHELARQHGLDTIVLSGGCFANRVLFEDVCRRVRALGLQLLTHARVPPGDGGIALGQAAIGAAHRLCV